MVDVPFSLEEIEVMRFALDSYRKALLFEIANTDTRDLRVSLREREVLLEEIADKLGAFAEAAAEPNL
jgi:hypothetical protein